MKKASLQLTLVDVRGNEITDDVEIIVKDLRGIQRYRENLRVKGTVKIDCPVTSFSDTYKVEVWPSNYQLVQFYLTLKSGQVTTPNPIMFPVDAGAVVGITAPRFDQLDQKLQDILHKSRLISYPCLKGSSLYDELKDPRKAALLNLFAKASNTWLTDGKTCADHFGGLVKLRRDRFFAKTSAVLLEEVQDSPEFHKVSGALHDAPDDYNRVASYKTYDSHGNLQLTFFRRKNGGDDYLVDVDIDKVSGWKHPMFEVSKNKVLGSRTNPYDVREILIAKQGIYPGYDFVF